MSFYRRQQTDHNHNHNQPDGENGTHHKVHEPDTLFFYLRSLMILWEALWDGCCQHKCQETRLWLLSEDLNPATTHPLINDVISLYLQQTEATYSREILLETLVVSAQTGGLRERHASGVAPVPLTVAALRGGGVRTLEELLPHGIIGVWGRTGPGARDQALHLSGLCFAEGAAHFLCTESGFSFFF